MVPKDPHDDGIRQGEPLVNSSRQRPADLPVSYQTRRWPKRTFVAIGLVLFSAILVACWLREDPVINRINYFRIHEGMTIEEVTAILGDPGPSYSSDTSVDYYIWKGRSGWISVLVKENRVTSKQYRPEMKPDD